MEVILICVAIAVLLFVSAYLTRRRFGLLGLALAAGSILSGIWGYDAGLIASGLGFPVGSLTTAVTLAIIVLLPAGVLLFHGYIYKTFIGRIVGAALFTLLALAFLIEPLGHVLMPQGFGADVYNWLSQNRTAIIGGGLIAAVIDLFLTKPASEKRGRR
ncbi:MAG TPA: hypothetical protein PK265_01975 [Candidatus Saccharibacteria bacterium]|nr:hypothetical protein [Candidatus Saccharibacteria bacterium]HRQ98074.1 hypothetical protein [Candidatus Saccharibacteria bacterium]